MGTTKVRTISVRCVVCLETFSYQYRGGRKQKTCSSTCKRKQGATVKARERVKACLPEDEYPTGYSRPKLPKPADDSLRIRHLRNAGELRALIEYQAGERDEDDDEGTEPFIAGLDDYREPDRYPLANLPVANREAAEQWMREHSDEIPAGGYWVGISSPELGKTLGALVTPSPRKRHREMTHNGTPLLPLVPFSATV